MTKPASRRELIAWFVATTMTVTALLVWEPGPLGAQESRDPTPSPEAASQQTAYVEDGSAADGYTFTSPTNWVFLATGANFADALGAGAVAGMTLGPVLLVERDSIPGPTMSELNRLEPQHVRVVGGTAVISDAVLAQVEALPYTNDVVRVSGTNRYATAAAVSSDLFPSNGYYPRVAFATEANLPDGGGTGADPQTLLTIDEFETGGGVLLVTAGAQFWEPSPTTEGLSCWIEVDGVPVSGSLREVILNDDTFDWQHDCTTQAALVVDWGLHTIEYVADWWYASADGGTMWAIYNPFQQEGWRISP